MSKENKITFPDFEIQVGVNGKIFMPAKETFLYLLSQFKGKSFLFKLVKISKRNASNLQFAYYFPVVVYRFMLEANLQGNDFADLEESHQALKEIFADKYFRKTKSYVYPDGTTKKVIYKIGCSDLDTIQMCDYVDDCINFIKEFYDYQCPEPDKKWKLNKK